MIYVTGDCHADFTKFSTKRFPEQREMTRDDLVIVCGDFGLWHDGPDERYWLKWLAQRKFTLLFVDGNHENFDRLYSDEFPIVDFCGGKAHRIRKNIYHLMRGYVFDLQGKKFFAFGGASSHDIEDGIINPEDFNATTLPFMELMQSEDLADRISYNECMRRVRAESRRLDAMGNPMHRIEHISWWRQELPSADEMLRGLSALRANDYRVDYVISHCCPQSIATMMSPKFSQPDKLTKYFDEVSRTIDFSKWYCGHYHGDDYLLGKYRLLYHKIERII